MKRFIFVLIAISLLSINLTKAQNPFKKYGVEVGVITLSKGKYIEFIPYDSIQHIGSVVINIKTGHIIELINTDSVELGYNYRPDVASRWMSPDPLTEEFNNLTPYNYCENNPIKMMDPDGRSGIVTIEGNTMTISANMIIYGSYANQSMANNIARSIQDGWNKAGGTMNYQGKEYNVKFAITGISNPDITSEEVFRNEDLANNYFRVEDIVHQADNSSYVDDIGGNTGEFALGDITNHNTMTESHEFGHLLGLVHSIFGPDSNTPVNKQDVNPGIMIPRGTTSPDSKYNIDPKDKNSTVNGSKRVVRKENIQMLSSNIKIDPKTGKGTIGQVSREYHPKAQPRN